MDFIATHYSSNQSSHRVQGNQLIIEKIDKQGLSIYPVFSLQTVPQSSHITDDRTYLFKEVVQQTHYEKRADESIHIM